MSSTVLNPQVRTVEEWQAWVQRTEPEDPRLDRAALAALTPEQRRRHDRARGIYNTRQRIIRVPDLPRLENIVEEHLMVSANALPNARRGLAIDGHPTVGKTTLMLALGRVFDRWCRELYPERDTADNVCYTPVIYWTLPQAASPKAMAMGLSDYLNIPYTARDSEASITRRLLKVLGTIGTELVLLDDIHYLDLSHKDGRLANDYLKYLSNNLAATFVYAGVELQTSALFNEGYGAVRDTQTSGRFAIYRLQHYRLDDTESARRWSSLVATIESQLALYAQPAGDLAAHHSEYLYERTSGSISALYNLITRASINAIRTGDEHITRAHLTDVLIAAPGAHYASHAA